MSEIRDIKRKNYSQDLIDSIDDAKKKGKDYYIIPSRAMNRFRKKKKRHAIIK